MRFKMNFQLLPRCGAKARSNGYQPCRQAAMSNGRCYYHGGSTLIKHGHFTKAAQEKNRLQRCSIKEARELNKSLAIIINKNHQEH